MKRSQRLPNVRDMILDGVDQLLERYGYRKMTMDDLARLVGIGKGTLYLYFSGKEELVLSHVDRIVDRLLEKIRSIAETASAPPEKIYEMLVARVMVRFDSVVSYSDNLNDLLSAVRAKILARRRSHFLREAEELALVLESGKKTGRISCPNCPRTAMALIWGTNALLPFNLSARDWGSRETVEERIQEIARLLLAGLVRRSR